MKNLSDTMLLKIAAAYIRVSDERQDEYSPDSQLKKVREHAEKEGYQIPDEYVFYDDGISGRSTKKRADFNRMIAMAKEKDRPFDKIYVWKFSRFARNQEEAIAYKSLLSKKGVAVVSVSEPIPEGHFGSLIERIIEWTDEYYSVNLSTEVTRGMTEKVSRGEPICPPAFGYFIKEKKYYPNEEQALIVKEVFERFAAGEGMRRIAMDLANRGVKTTRGNAPDNRYVEYMLNNPLYIGKLRWSQEGTRAVHSRNYNHESVMIIDGNHEAIISEELWKKVQSRLEQQKKAYTKYARKEQEVEYMLKGLVRCSACGSTLAAGGRWGKKQTSYSLQCCNYARGTCHTSHSISVTKLEKAVVDALKDALKNNDFVIVPNKKSDRSANTPDFDKLIAIEERKLDRAKQAYLAEVDTIEQYAKNKKEIEKQIAKLRQLRDKTPKPSPNSRNIAALANKVNEVVRFVESDKHSPKAKNEALRTIINKIIYNKPTEHISIFFQEI